MQTAEKTLSRFLEKFCAEITELCLLEGFKFQIKETERSITVKCTLPDGYVRFIVFDDHRKENPHGEKPHVCNQWYKGLGLPLSFTIGSDVKDITKVSKIISACALMCITQTKAYTEIKEMIFT